ncbi:hypothetical protein CPLU01_02040 [Colletotrichum plurivorum]|uniref:Uncharacterized protein n=1 Tax=Colletotrichum plurivorum TaxID=2175906 RepID=A0A8H6NNG0_9PEZI|nr:hypothetical protein CPLU01_02040 [Colletotrichum plurivorum]
MSSPTGRIDSSNTDGDQLRNATTLSFWERNETPSTRRTASSAALVCSFAGSKPPFALDMVIESRDRTPTNIVAVWPDAMQNAQKKSFRRVGNRTRRKDEEKKTKQRIRDARRHNTQLWAPDSGPTIGTPQLDSATLGPAEKELTPRFLRGCDRPPVERAIEASVATSPPHGLNPAWFGLESRHVVAEMAGTAIDELSSRRSSHRRRRSGRDKRDRHRESTTGILELLAGGWKAVLH